MIGFKFIGSRFFLIAAFCLFLSISQIRAAVSIDNRSAGGAADNVGLASLTWSHQVNAGTESALFVGVSTATTTAPASLPTNRVLSVTYNGVALTRIGTVVSPNTLNASELFRLVNPTVGTANVVVTFSSTTATIPVLFVNQAVGSSISFFGVSQTTPNGAFSSASGTDNSPTVAVAGSVGGDFVFDNLAAAPGAVFLTAGANQTVCTDENDETTCTRGRRFFFNSYDVGAASTKPGASPSVTMTWTLTTASDWALGATVVRQSVATAAAVTIAGRITTVSGKGVARARVTMTDASGETRTALTNFFGYYRFKSVGVGETYIFNAASKYYSFNPRVITIQEELTELNFVAEP